MKIGSKVKLILLLSLVFIGFLTIKSFAAISVSPSKTTVSPGETFTVNISSPGLTGKAGISVSNGTASTSAVWLEPSSSISVTAGSSGTVSISVSSIDMSDSAGNEARDSGSASVAIQSSSNNGNQGGNTGTANTPNPSTPPAPTASLTNLGIRPHDFSGFRSGTTSYTANVPNDCTSVEVYASTAAGQISGTGTKTLKEGSNPFTITVTNGGVSKSYTLNVIRATSGEETEPNHPDEETEDGEENEENPGIGLSELKIPGITFDKEFATDVYEYTVKVEDDITVDYLAEMKEKIVATANAENFQTEITTAILADNKGTITISVKDDEREYAKYVITFEKEEKEEDTPAVLLTNVSNNNSGNGGTVGMPFELMVGILVVGYGVTLFFAVFFAIKCYLKDRELEEYEEHEFGTGNDIEDAEYNNPLGEVYNGFSKNENPEENVDRTSEIYEETEPTEEAKEVASSLGKLAGYRNLRGSGRASGRHF